MAKVRAKIAKASGDGGHADLSQDLSDAPGDKAMPATESRQAATKTVTKGRRAAGPVRRRRQIVEAARRILIERPESFSMRNLAAEASISVFTIYNLVGGQAAVIEAVVNDPSREQVKKMRRRPLQSPVEQLYREILSYDRVWNDESPDILATVRALPYLAPGALQAWFRQGFTETFLPLFEAGVAEGELRPEPNSDVLIYMLSAIASQAGQNWSVGAHSFTTCKRIVLMATCLMVLSVIQPEGRKQWEDLLEELTRKGGAY